MTTPYELLVDYKLAVVDAIRAALTEQRMDKVVIVGVERPVADLAFFTLRFSLSGDALATVDAAWDRWAATEEIVDAEIIDE